MGWNPHTWTNERKWSVQRFAAVTAPAVTVAGLGLAVVGSVASARPRPNQAFLGRFEAIGWGLVGAGVALFLLMWLARDAEKPRPYRIRLIFPEAPALKPIGPTTKVFGLVLDNALLINESDETVSLEFTLNCDRSLGVYPYRNYYRQNRSALVDDYLSNPRHLGPRDRAEAHLPFMSDDDDYYSDADSCMSLTVSVNPPNGDTFHISLPTDEQGSLIEGRIDPIVVNGVESEEA